jgi:hypothetical protein
VVPFPARRGGGGAPTGTPPGFYSVCIGGSVSGIKWPGREIHHSFPSSAAVKNDCSYFSDPPRAFLASIGTVLCF